MIVFTYGISKYLNTCASHYSSMLCIKRNSFNLEGRFNKEVMKYALAAGALLNLERTQHDSSCTNLGYKKLH